MAPIKEFFAVYTKFWASPFVFGMLHDIKSWLSSFRACRRSLSLQQDIGGKCPSRLHAVSTEYTTYWPVKSSVKMQTKASMYPREKSHYNWNRSTSHVQPMKGCRYCWLLEKKMKCEIHELAVSCNRIFNTFITFRIQHALIIGIFCYFCYNSGLNFEL